MTNTYLQESRRRTGPRLRRATITATVVLTLSSGAFLAGRASASHEPPTPSTTVTVAPAARPVMTTAARTVETWCPKYTSPPPYSC